jgi:hypothetical protein
MSAAAFTVRVIGKNPHKEGTQIWRAGLIIAGMEGCDMFDIIHALTAFERVRSVGVQAPSRWISQFAGLESKKSGKSMEPWLEIMHRGKTIASRQEFKDILSSHGKTLCNE